MREISKPSLPKLKWDDKKNQWDEGLKWDYSGYATFDKPSTPSYREVDKTEFRNFLLTQDGDFLVFQDGSQTNIVGTNFREITKP